MAETNTSPDPEANSIVEGSALPYGIDAATAWAGSALRTTGFWSAIVLPFVAVGLLTIQPAGWQLLLVGVLLANIAALFAGHCHGVDC